jgi:hypothetical protein
MATFLIGIRILQALQVIVSCRAEYLASVVECIIEPIPLVGGGTDAVAA